jgi:hypothetical protein
MKTVLQIARPYVHGSVSVSWIGEVLMRLHLCTDALSVNAVPVIIEGVLVCSGDEWRFESFGLQRMAPRIAWHVTGRQRGGLKTSRRNQERAREVILDVVSQWAGGRPQEIQLPRCAPESRAEGALLVEALGAC